MKGQLGQIRLAATEDQIANSHSIRGKEVRGRVQEGEGGLVVCKDSQGHEWASGVMLEAPSKGMTEDCDLCSEAG